MHYTIFDTETTTSNKGNPFDLTNSLVCSGFLSSNTRNISIDYYPTGEKFQELDKLFIREGGLVIGFNLKFDLNWWRKLGGSYPKFVWDCQIAEFLLSNQEHKYPSLDEALEKYGFPLKYDTVKNEYWEKNINTDQIPRDILTMYLEGDLLKTEQVFKQQYHMFQSEQYKHLYPLFKLQCQDLLVLADMEYNGVYFNVEEALKRAHEIQTRQNEIKAEISYFVGGIPYSLTSDSHLSAILYGGIILEEYHIPIGVYKSGNKKGEVRYRLTYKSYELPRLIKPLNDGKVNESKKEQEFVAKGILTAPRITWQVNEDTFKKLKPKGDGKVILELIMEFNKLDKFRSTYLEGWAKIIETMNWEKNMIHGQLNQCLAITGRLSSSKPNMQNADEQTKKYCESLYE